MRTKTREGRVKYRPRGRGSWRVKRFKAKRLGTLRKEMDKWVEKRLVEGILVRPLYEVRIEETPKKGTIHELD